MQANLHPSTLLFLLVLFVYIPLRKEGIFMITKNEMIFTEKQTAVLKKVFGERQLEKTLAESICTELPKKVREYRVIRH